MEPDILESNSGSMSVTEVTGLVQLFNNSLLAMEGRLVAKMDDSSRLASERWIKHDRDSERIVGDIEKRIVTVQCELQKEIDLLATTLKDHIGIANTHWEKEHEEEIRLDARLTPVKGALAYVRRNWKTILLVIMSILAVVGFSRDTLHQLVEALGL